MVAMKGNHFTISAMWGPNPETPERIGAGMLRSLDRLSAISPLLHPWWVGDHSLSIAQMADLVDENRVSEMSSPLDEWRGKMTELVERGVARDDWENPQPQTGYAVSAYNALTDSPRLVSLSVNGGGGAAGRNSGLRFETNSFPDARIVSYPIMRSVLMTLSGLWKVTEAQAFSSALQNCWRTVPWSRQYDLAWMTYLSAPLAQQIKPPLDVTTERTSGGGLLLVATDETFDVGNAQHMAAARRIVEALAPLNGVKDREDTLWLDKQMKGKLLSNLLHRVLLSPGLDEHCLDDTSPEFKAQMKGVLESLLSGDPDEATLRDRWRRIDHGIVRPDISLRAMFETILSWLR